APALPFDEYKPSNHRTVARSTAYPLRATSSTLRATTSQPRSLLSMARLNIAKSRPSLDLQLGPDRPDVLWPELRLCPERRLCPDQLALVPRHALGCDWGCVFVILH